jgi:hypothetical protein
LAAARRLLCRARRRTWQQPVARAIARAPGLEHRHEHGFGR